MLEVSRKKPYLILGALGLGSFLSVEKSFEILKKALELGITDIDCAVSYGNGAARKIIGSFHKSGGSLFNIWEKIGLEMNENSFGIYEAETLFPNPENIEIHLERMLEIYQTEMLYSIQLHAPLPNSLRVNTLRSLKLEQNKGKYKHLGISNHETFELLELSLDCALTNLHISSNQVHFNIAEQKGRNEVIARSYLENIPVVANRVLARGLLAFINQEDSLRLAVSTKTRVQYDKFESFYGGIKSILAEVADRPTSESAISWVLHQEGICAVTLGISSVSQLDSAIQAINYPLEKSQIELIDFEIARRFGEDVFKLPATMFDRNY
jgi:aryl-alcohol dehydrogenase-like predicted oxidoreductase